MRGSQSVLSMNYLNALQSQISEFEEIISNFSNSIVVSEIT